MKKITLARLITILFAVLVIAACDNDKPADNTTTPPDITVNENGGQEPVQQKAAITPKDSILSKLRAYYEALGNESGDVGTYFSPTVSRYFSRENISRSEVQKSIIGTYKTFESRIVMVDPNSIKLTEEDDGWWAEFKGSVAYMKSDDGSTGATEDEFHNLFRFDQDYLIDQYGAYSQERDPAAAFQTRDLDATPSAKAANPDLQSTVRGISEALAAGNWEKLDSYLMPEHGLYLSLRPGAFDAVYHGESITNLMEYMPWYKGGIENFGCSPEQSDVPNFSCETAKMFSKQGCFLAPLKKYSRLSDMMANLNSYEVSDYSVSEIAKARKAEATAGYQLVHTREGLQIIFGKNAAGAWKLLVLDFSRFSCGA